MRPLFPLAFALASTLLLASTAGAQTLRVDLALDDFTDFGGAQGVADLPGPDGHITLREAVTAANNTPGPQTITFAIPTSEYSIFYADRAIIRLEQMLYVSDDGTTLDFASQALFSGDTNPAGGEVGLQYAGPPAAIPCLWLAADHCTVRGLDTAFGNNFSNTIWITGSHNRVLGCTTNALKIRGDFGAGAFNEIGGTAPGEGNTFSEGVALLSHANDNVLVGNTFLRGLQVVGDTFYGTCDRNRIGGPSAAERNLLAGNGRYGEEGFPTGAQLEIAQARDTLVEGNYVGTTADGSTVFPGRSGTGGIAVGTGAIGTVLRGNLVAGIAMDGINHYLGQRFGAGIVVVSSAEDTLLVGNRLGVAADGVSPIPSYEGIVVLSNPNGAPSNVRIGGSAPGEGNLVAFHETDGVRIGGSASGVRLQRNTIRDNGGLGIDLVGLDGPGVTPNDALDADLEGGNHLQNFPVLERGLTAGSGVMVRGRLGSEPLQAYELEFFTSASADASGFGEGARFLGSLPVRTDALGEAHFVASFLAHLPTGSVLSATATHLGRGETSEFSRATALKSIRRQP